MKLNKGISPVLSTLILIGVVVILGLSLMTYSISLSNMQSSEVRLRNMLVDEASKVLIYIEREEVSPNNIAIYLGLTKVLPEPGNYSLTLFKSNEYQSTYGLIPIGANVSQVSPNINPSIQTLQPSKTYVVDAAGNYVPLSALRLQSINSYSISYIPQISNSSLIKIEVSRGVIGNFKYVVPIILMDLGSEYYEVARIYWLNKWW